ncbi:MAG: glycosyltransferase family 39 protein [Planctomycetes bacterium]|nr:glycosyltransferase family 39 protein [Planctomycetota bacterium]
MHDILLAWSEAGDTGPLSALALAGFTLFALAVVLAVWRTLRATAGGDPQKDRRLFLLLVIVAGFAVRVAVAALFRMNDQNTVIAPDEETFDGNAALFAGWLRGEQPLRLSPRYLRSSQVGYFYFVGFLYYLFGHEPFVAVLANCLIGAVTALPVYRIAERLGGQAAARPATVLATFFPSVLLWSALLIRDSLVVFVLMLIVDAQMRLAERFGLLRLLRLGLCLILLGTLRQYLFLLMALSAAVSLLVGRAGRIGPALLKGVAAILLIAVIMRVAGFGLWEMERASLADLNLQRKYSASVESAQGSFRPEVDISSPGRAIAWLPVGVAYFLFAPFPWQVLSGRQKFGLPDVICFYLLLPAVIRGILVAVRRRLRESVMLLLMVVSITVLYALVEGNVGIVFRHRAQVLVPFMIFAGLGIAAGRERAAAASKAVAAPKVGVAGVRP